MMDVFFGKKRIKKVPPNSKDKSHSVPVKELNKDIVSAQRFNDMISYYTHELTSRLDELEAIKAQNDVVMKTALKQGSRNDERLRELARLREENRILNERVKELEQKSNKR